MNVDPSIIPEFDKLRLHLEHLEQENELLREQVRLLRAQLFGKKSERFRTLDDSQFLLFEEADGIEKRVEPEKIEIPAHTRKKGGRKPLPEDLPRVEVTHDISEEEKICSCGCTKNRIGEEVSEQLDIIPASFQVIRHIRPKYACRSCEGVEDNGPTVAIAPPPAQIIPKSIVSGGLLAHILITKFADAVPFYRQEGQFARLGIEINRTSMCSWAIKAAEVCQVLLELLRKEILSGPLISIDETTVQVLSEPGRSPTQKSYMWIFRGGDPERPALEFQYHPTRESGVPSAYLNGYQGYIQTDGYGGYDFLDKQKGIIHVGCWAHARRKFAEIIKSAGKSCSHKRIGIAEQAVKHIRKLYNIEKDARNRDLSAEEIYQLRQEQSKPLVAEFHALLKGHLPNVPPQSLLGKAISYTLGQWPRLEKYLEDGRIRMDNNLTENAIRPFVVGRRNWLFNGTVDGARASATIFTLIENAKANGFEPYWYLRHLFDRLPLAKDKEELRALLPQYINKSQLPQKH